MAKRAPLVCCVVALAATIACFPKGWSGAPSFDLPASGSPFDVGPYLILVRHGTLAVVIEHELDEPPVVEWWQGEGIPAASSHTHRVVASEDYGIWTAVLEDLPLDERLSYRILSSAGDAGPFPFRAGVSRGRPFRFAAFGDTRTNHGVHRALIDAMAGENIDFVIHSGDLVTNGGVQEEWDLFFAIEAPVMSRHALLAAVGNHDVGGPEHFRRYFRTELYAGTERYACHDWGDLRIVILDSETEMRRPSAQYELLEACLREAAARSQLSVISLHYPPYSSGEHGSYLEVREVIGEVAPRYGVELVLAGHDHNYERTEVIDGVTYIVAASGGAPIRKISPSSFSVMLRTEPHYVLFDVEHDRLIGRAVNLTGDVFDSFVIMDNLPGPLHP